MNDSHSDRSKLRVSIVIPMYNEAENISPLFTEIVNALTFLHTYEVVFVDDSSCDDTVEHVRKLSYTDPDGYRIRLIRHGQRRGKSAALLSGVRFAHGDWIVMLDADGQQDPRDIPLFLDCITQAHDPLLALVSGIRIKRNDSWQKRFGSRLANLIRKNVLRDGCADSGCSLQLYRREVFLDLPYFSSLHRFLPALFQAYGYHVHYITVTHRARRYGQSKYDLLGRGLISMIDLLGVLWLTHRVASWPIDSKEEYLKTDSHVESRDCPDSEKNIPSS